MNDNPYQPTPSPGSPSGFTSQGPQRGPETMTLKSLGVLSVGKIMGATYAALGLLLGAFFSLFAILGAAIGAGRNGPGPVEGIIFGAMAIVFVPVFYGILGFVGGIIGAVVYNVIAKYVGGIEFEFQSSRRD